MLKRIFLILSLIVAQAVFSQNFLTVSNITKTGNFANCGGANPTITAQMITSDGSQVVNGNLQITDPCGYTTLRIVMSNLRYDQPGANWAHGFFFPEGENITVNNVTLPAGWIAQSTCTGAPCSAQQTGGVGFYYDGTAGNSCCGGAVTNDGIPSNNYGQSSMNCSTPFTIGFDMTFCNSRVETTTTFFTLSGSSDGNTGCWSIPDVLTNTVGFSINTIESTIPLFSVTPSSPQTITECLNGGAQMNYIAVFEGECGTGENITWWTSPVGGAMIGQGSPFYFDPPGQACPQGLILYASCCPGGGGCERRPVLVGPCLPPSAEPTFAPIPPQCPGLDSPLPNTSIEGASGTWSPVFDPFNTQTYTFTPNPGQCVTQSLQVEVEILPLITVEIPAMDPICQNSTPPPLPNPNPNVPGTWTPAVIDTGTPGVYQYTFQPDGACAEDAVVEVTILEEIIPDFILQTQYCQGTEIINLPTTSDNGYTGTWTPAQIDTSIAGTTTYTFTPSGEGCTEEYTIDIQVVETIIPTFEPIPDLCQYSTPPALPQPNEGVTGTWSPAVINTNNVGTFNYTFTPDLECSEAVTIQVTISIDIMAQFNLATGYCQNETPAALPQISNNGVTGVWVPSTIDTSTPGTTTYTFTPDDGQCSTQEYQFNVQIFAKPTLNTVPTQTLCDDDFDGVYHTNLNSLNALLGGGAGATYKYYASLVDYNNGNAIPAGQLSNYSFNNLPTTIYATGSNAQGCVSDVRAIIFDKGETVEHANGPFGPIGFCDGDPTDLTQFEAQISGVAGVVFEYYNTQSNAASSSNQIANPGSFNPSANQTAVFVRIEANGFCSAIVEISLNKELPPDLELPGPILLCIEDSQEVTATSSDPNAIFEWTLPNGSIVEGATIIINDVGTYSVIAHTPFGCTSEVKTLTAVHPAPPIITHIEINGSNIIVGATNQGEGIMEYSLDGVFWQNSNMFGNLIPGEIYTVWVRSGGCMIAKQEVSILSVPNFISPNGDGVNDTWSVRGIQTYQGATIKIFDRYGKVFVDRKLTNSYEWDGRYLGRAVPSDDYWYIIHVPANDLTVEQKFIGHISVRN